MVIYKGPDGRTQDVQDFEVVRASILLRLGWKPVEEATPVEPELLADDASADDELEPASRFIGRKPTKK